MKNKQVMGFKHVNPDPHILSCLKQLNGSNPADVFLSWCFSCCCSMLCMLRVLHYTCPARHLDYQGCDNFRKHFSGPHDSIILGPVCVSIRLAECGRHQKSSAALSPEGEQLLVAPIVFRAAIRLGLTYQRLVYT